VMGPDIDERVADLLYYTKLKIGTRATRRSREVIAIKLVVSITISFITRRDYLRTSREIYADIRTVRYRYFIAYMKYGRLSLNRN
jgi:hypothetical protein